MFVHGFTDEFGDLTSDLEFERVGLGVGND